MDVLINLVVGFFTLDTYIKGSHVYFKYITTVFVNYTSGKLEK